MSWPELFGLVARDTRRTPAEVAEMDSDDLADLTASWRRWPPEPIALRGIRSALVAGFGLQEKSSGTSPGEAHEPMSEQQIRRMVDAMNAQFVRR